jgi:hypothetical protein
MSTCKWLLVFAIVLGFGTSAWAGCCAHCGRECECRSVCHLKCEKKKVTKVEFSCECEDFCVPCKSEKCGTQCECKSVEGLCGGCKEICCEKPVYRPTSAVIHTRKKLVKHEVTKEEPSYKWVVEKVCDGCSHGCHTCDNGKSPAQIEAEVRAEMGPSSSGLVASETEAPKASWLSSLFRKGE